MATLVSDILSSVGFRLFPDGSTLISSTSTPTQSECIKWINETCEELLTVCVELGSEVARTAPATITLADGTASYSDLATSLFSPVIYRDEQGEQFSGWIEQTNTRLPLRLMTEAELINYPPSLEGVPNGFYIDGSNNLVFVPTPDTAYTAKIPYYGYLTTIALVSDTVPFLRIFDHVITESLVMRSQNRDEYELGFELKWFQYLRGQARKILLMRKNPTTRILV